MLFLAIVIFILIFSLLILVHEWGHFYFARRAGIKVEEFGIGLPPRIAGFKLGETVYSINWIPFGGFVKIYGENEIIKGDKRAFSNKSPGWRMLVISAGVLMNILTGFLVLMIGFWLSMPPLVTSPEAYVGDSVNIESKVVVLNVLENSPADQAQLVPGDYIIGSGQTVFSLPDDLRGFLSDKSGQPVDLIINRSGQQSTITITPIAEAGEVFIGVWIDRFVEQVSYVWWQVPWFALQETIRLLGVIIVVIARFIYQLFSTASLPSELTGPVGIAKITVDLLHLGWLRILQFIVFLSFNLGIINLVPFPALDGGRLLFVILEVLRGGKRVSSQVEGTVHAIGFILLMLLIVVVTYKDIVKLF